MGGACSMYGEGRIVYWDLVRTGGIKTTWKIQAWM